VSIHNSERLAEAGIEPSLGSRGDNYTLEWVSWLNKQRLLAPIRSIPPAEAEANYYGQLAGQAARVRLTPTGFQVGRGGALPLFDRPKAGCARQAWSNRA